MNKKITVELSLYADVEITDEICNGIAEQYPDWWERNKNDPEEIASAMVFAIVNPRIPCNTIPSSFNPEQWWWDGVGSLDNLITNIELQ
jgi:hypothetical protein